MPIHGLANQWKTYEALLDGFAAILKDGTGDLVVKYRMIREILVELHSTTDSMVFVGTSHSSMNFGTRDSVSQMDRTQPFAFLDVVADKTSGQYSFQVRTREIDGNRPTSKWSTVTTTDIKLAAKIIRDALLYDQVPQRQSR